MREPLLFVYGTLLYGSGHRRIDQLIASHTMRLGTGTVQARVYDLGPYPGAIPHASPTDYVTGHVLRLRGGAATLRILDRYEQYDPRHPTRSVFVRARTPVTLHDGRKITAWIYWYNRPVMGKRRMDTNMRKRNVKKRPDSNEPLPQGR